MAIFPRNDIFLETLCTLPTPEKRIAVAKRHIFRRACAIPDEDSVVITGGRASGTRKKASRYNRQGWVEDLPDISIGRLHHACAGYTKNGEQVST